MCGIIGYTGGRICKPFLIGGLERLEYRGYDSAGISLIDGDELEVVRAVGNLSVLQAGRGHERLARHDRHRAHALGHARPPVGGQRAPARGLRRPLLRRAQRHRRELRGAQGAADRRRPRVQLARPTPRSSRTCSRRTTTATSSRPCACTFLELHGHFAFCVVSPLHPQMIVGARLQCPMVIGLGEGETFLASDVVAFLEHTREAKLVGDRELVVITPEGAAAARSRGPARSSAPPRRSRGTPPPPRRAATRRSCSRRSTSSPTRCARRSASASRAARSCSTRASPTSSCSRSTASRSPPAARPATPAWSAAYLIEQWARLPVDIEYASEFRYRYPVVDERTLAIAVSQSGETADTIAAQRVAREGGALHARDLQPDGLAAHARGRRHALHPQRPRDRRCRDQDVHVAVHGVHAARAAPRRAARHAAAPSASPSCAAGIDALPELAAAYLAEDAPVWAQTERIAGEVWEKEFFLYIGRHLGMPVCLEGALKLKEISYIPTDSYAAGEMKHGPIALLSEDTPVVAVMNDSHVYEKVVSNVQEVRARGARVIAVITEGNEDASASRRLDAADPAHRARARAHPRVDAAADPGLPHRAPARPADRPAAQPREDRHRRVAGCACGRNCGAAWRSCRSASSTRSAARCATSCSGASRRTSTSWCAGTASRSCSRSAARYGHADELRVAGRLVGVRFWPPWGPREGIEVVPPRRETPIAPGEPGFTGNPHTDFRIEPDPELPVRDDLERRDFTVNAMARDVRTRRVDRPLRRPRRPARRRAARRARDGVPRRPAAHPARRRALQHSTGCSPMPATRELMTAAAPRIAELSAERVREELDRTLAGAGAADGAAPGARCRCARGRAARVGALHRRRPALGHAGLHARRAHPARARRRPCMTRCSRDAAPGRVLARRGQAATPPARASHAEEGARITPRRAAAPDLRQRHASRGRPTLVREHSYDEDREPSAHAARVFLARVGRERARDLLALRRWDRIGRGVPDPAERGRRARALRGARRAGVGAAGGARPTSP